MSTREGSDAERRETFRAYEDHRLRFVASGGDGAWFDGLHLAAAAVRRAERTLDVLQRSAGMADRAATEPEIRVTLSALADEAIAARSAGTARQFRRKLWPFGAPMDG